MEIYIKLIGKSLLVRFFFKFSFFAGFKLMGAPLRPHKFSLISLICQNSSNNANIFICILSILLQLISPLFNKVAWDFKDKWSLKCHFHKAVAAWQNRNVYQITMICRANASVEVYSLIKSFIYRGNGHKVILGTNGWLKGRTHFSLTKKLLSKIKSFKRSSSANAWLHTFKDQKFFSKKL